MTNDSDTRVRLKAALYDAADLPRDEAFKVFRSTVLELGVGPDHEDWIWFAPKMAEILDIAPLSEEDVRAILREHQL